MIVNFKLNALAAEVEAEVATLRFGTDGTATSPTDTALKAQVGSIAATVSRAGAVVTVKGTWTNSTGARKTIREYGLFDAGANLLGRIAEADADGGSGIVREVPNGQDLTVDAWTITTKDG